MRAQDNWKRRQCLAYLEGNRKKCNGHRKSFRIDETTPLTLETGEYSCILCYEMEVASLFNKLLVLSCEERLCRLYFSEARGELSWDAESAVATICY